MMGTSTIGGGSAIPSCYSTPNKTSETKWGSGKTKRTIFPGESLTQQLHETDEVGKCMYESQKKSTSPGKDAAPSPCQLGHR
jgi:hypothetical protein